MLGERKQRPRTGQEAGDNRRDVDVREEAEDRCRLTAADVARQRRHRFVDVGAPEIDEVCADGQRRTIFPAILHDNNIHCPSGMDETGSESERDALRAASTQIMKQYRDRAARDAALILNHGQFDFAPRANCRDRRSSQSACGLVTK